MSYNGIGLQTPRGSATSGYVQKKTGAKKTEGVREKRQREAAEEHRRSVKMKMAEARSNAGADVRDHDEKRQIEVKCMELREKLEEDDVEDVDIEKAVSALRRKLIAKKEERIAREDAKEKEKELEKKKEESDDSKSRQAAEKQGSPEPLYNYVPRYGNR